MPSALNDDRRTRPFPLRFSSLSSPPHPRIFTSLFVGNRVIAPIDFHNTQVLVENQKKAFPEHAHTNYFGCHGPHPLLPLLVELPSQKPFTAFHFSVMPRLSTKNFLGPSALQCLTLTSIVEIGLAIFFYPNECSVF